MKLLYVDCCITVHKVSRTKLLADTFLAAWQKAHPADEIEILDLKALSLTPLMGDALVHREEMLDNGCTDSADFALARQFAAADRIVIAAPYWELSFPAQLRLYIEHISALNITFGYGEGGASRGLCRAEKLLFLTTSGGDFTAANCGSDHLRALCGMFGIPDYQFLGAALQDVREVDHTAILSRTLTQAAALAETF